MHVQQRNVTTVNLHHGSVSSFALRKFEHNYQLSIASADQVVNILLSPHDLQRLRYEVGKGEVCEPYAYPEPAAEPVRHARPTPCPSEPLEWLAFN
jgi:hypothetical protein